MNVLQNKNIDKPPIFTLHTPSLEDIHISHTGNNVQENSWLANIWHKFTNKILPADDHFCKTSEQAYAW